MPFALAAVLMGQGACAESGNTLSVHGAAPDGRGGFAIREIALAYDPGALADPEGAGALYGRISAAADKICRLPEHTLAAWRYAQKLETCRRRAVQAAVETVDAPLLTRRSVETAEK